MDSTRFAKANNIPVRLMHEVVGVLVRARLLGEVTGEGQEHYALLQAPEHVSVKKIYDLMIMDGSAPEDLGLSRTDITEQVLAAAGESLERALNSITLSRLTETLPPTEDN